MPKHHVLSPTPGTVHWGHFDAKIPPRLTVESDKGIHAMVARNLVEAS